MKLNLSMNVCHNLLVVTFVVFVGFFPKYTFQYKW